MSKRILFLYSDVKYKNDILECEAVVKAALRKFRKTAVFSYRQIDLAPVACHEESCAILKEAANCDAVIWNGGAGNFADERIFATNGLGVFAAEHFVGGRCICSPLSLFCMKKDSKAITLQRQLPLSDIEKTFSLASLRTCNRKHSLLICTDDKTLQDNLLLKEFEYALGNEKSITVNYQSFNQLIWECTYQIPSFDVLLTTEEKAGIIVLHIASLQRVPSGTILWHAPNLRIYRREIFSDEDLSNSALASLLFTCANAFIDELSEKSAGEWLRRSTTLALEQYSRTSRSDFLNEVIRQINTPMRNRQVNSDDSKN